MFYFSFYYFYKHLNALTFCYILITDMLYNIISVQIYDATALAFVVDFYALICVRKTIPTW